MDWKVFISTFGLILLAELGDKTQLAAITMVTSSKKPLEVFIGSVLALSIITAIGILIGEALIKMIPKNIIHLISSLLFILIGILMLFKRF